MSIMHHIDKKQLIFLIVIGVLFFAGTVYRQNANPEIEKSTDADLDEILLTDLQNAEIGMHDSILCILQCEELNTTDLKHLFTSANLDYSNCDFKNCHNVTYALQGKTQSGKKVYFTLETGDTGNAITKLQVDGNTTCACS